MYEVELKYRVADRAGVERRLADLGARFAPVVEQVDRYFAHPCRDFATTDEALRLRRTGDAVAITWKGPRLAGATKTRAEIELPLTPGGDRSGAGGDTVARWADLLEALGFRPVREVAKRRSIATVRSAGCDVEVAIDEVVGLGCFLELEQLAAADEVDRARCCIEALARDVGCTTPERRSYLELLLSGG